MSNWPRHLYEFGPFVLDPADRTLMRDGCPLSLQPKVFDTLLVLVKNGGHLVEKNEFIRAIWPEEKFVEEGNLNKNISKLRLALGEGRGGTKYIETVSKRGYRFIAEVRTVDGGSAPELVLETQTRASLVVEEVLEDEPVAGAAVTKGMEGVVLAAAPSASKSERRLKSRPIAAAVAVLVSLAAAAYFFYTANRSLAIDSVAILPLVNDSGDPNMEYLSDGLSESLINSLSQLPELKVTARSSSFKYRGREIDAREAALALGVSAILTGRVSRRGDILLLNIELVDGRSNKQVWGGQYTRKESDLLQVQADLSREIGEALRLRLTAGERRQLARRGSVNPVAYALLLKGRFYWNKGGTENHKKALGYYQQAIEVDPAYAPAYATLSGAYGELVNTMVLDPKEFTPKAEMAARKALELDENLAEAHLAMADVNVYAWDWAAAEREHRRAIELNPNLAAAHRNYMFYLIIQGRNEEALAEGRRARDLDPLSRGVTAPVYELLLERRFDEAVGAAKRLLEGDQSNPDMHALVGFTFLRKGHYQEAVAPYREAIRLGDGSQDTQMFLGVAYAKAGEPGKAREILKRLEEGKQYVSPTGLAQLYAALGEWERAFSLLERAYSEHDQQLVWIGIEAAYEPHLRSDSRFQQLLRRVGLPQ